MDSSVYKRSASPDFEGEKDSQQEAIEAMLRLSKSGTAVPAGGSRVSSGSHSTTLAHNK